MSGDLLSRSVLGITHRHDLVCKMSFFSVSQRHYLFSLVLFCSPTYVSTSPRRRFAPSAGCPPTWGRRQSGEVAASTLPRIFASPPTASHAAAPRITRLTRSAPPTGEIRTTHKRAGQKTARTSGSPTQTNPSKTVQQQSPTATRGNSYTRSHPPSHPSLRRRLTDQEGHTHASSQRPHKATSPTPAGNPADVPTALT